MIIRGFDAISAAQQLGLPLGKYSEKSFRGFRLDLSIEQAFRLASRDQNLIFLEVEIQNLSIEQLLKLSAALGAQSGETCRQLKDQFEAEGDDDRAALFEALAKRWAALKAGAH